MTNTISIEQEKNWRVAQRLNRETRANPDSPYTGKYIGVWHGEVVAVGETLDEVCQQLDALGDRNFEAACVQASLDYDKPIYFSPWLRGKLTFIEAE